MYSTPVYKSAEGKKVRRAPHSGIAAATATVNPMAEEEEEAAGGGWPEPVVRVQSLSESGAATIPSRYIKPAHDRPNSSSAASAAITIPVVDLSSSSSSSSSPAAAAAVSAACREWGFFQAVNHGVPLDLLRRIRATWRAFFSQVPLEAKQRYANSPATYEGYGSRLGVRRGASLDWGDYFFLHLSPPRVASPADKWPRFPPGLRETTEEYGREVAKLCGRLMAAMAAGLGVGEGRMAEEFGGEEEAGACVRVNYYPRCPQPDLALGLSSHSDPGGMTVLLADEGVRGLQVRRPAAAGAGEEGGGDGWVTVDPIPGAFIVNVGDQIQVLTNAEYRSVEHRVLASAGAERLSIALFCNPRSDIPLAPMAELVSPERPPLYKPMTYDEYRLCIRRQGPQGKAQVDSLAQGLVHECSTG